jgi:hypothetical protein
MISFKSKEKCTSSLRTANRAVLALPGGRAGKRAVSQGQRAPWRLNAHIAAGTPGKIRNERCAPLRRC